jgi:DNA-binding TFAR19-related protein (PDSD5 family)
MTEQLEQITRNKLTQGQKRGMVPGRWSQRDYVNDRRNMEPVKPRSAAELRTAQSRLSELALDKDDPAEWLSDVLSALGLHRVISQA